MKALLRKTYGSADVLRVGAAPDPTIGDDDVLVRVRAASVNGADVENMRGTPMIRVTGPFRPRVKILGSDIAGVVESVGAHVTRFKPGDEVFGDLFDSGLGAFAEFARAPQKALLPKPTGLSFEDAATLPQAAVLALQGLRDDDPVQSGQRVLINGAGGGAGSFAIQIAKAFGADVTGVDSAMKLEMMRSIGADTVIDYAEQDFTQREISYDRILDFQAHRSSSDYRRVLAPDGVCLVVGGSTRRILQTHLAGVRLAMSSRQRLGLLMWRTNDEHDLGYLVDLVLAGTVTPAIDAVYPLSEAAEALRRTDAGEVQGKVVITM